MKKNKKSRSPDKGNRLTYPLPRQIPEEFRLSTLPVSSGPESQQGQISQLVKSLSSKLSYKSNINKMFYNEADLKNVTQYLVEGHQQLVDLINTLYKNKQNEDSQKLKEEEVSQDMIEQLLGMKKNVIHTPQMATKVNKFRKLLEFQDKAKKKEDKIQQTLFNIFEYHKSRKQFSGLKKLVLQNQLNKTQLDNAIFHQIAKTIAPKFKQTVYLPTTLRVTLTGVNWMDKQDQVASIALKIEARIHIPGFFHYPKTYTKLLKQKFKMSLKTQSHSYLRNTKVDLKQKKQSQKRQIIKGNDIFNDNVNKQFHPNPYEYFTEVYKWKNYYSQKELYFKKIREYEGCIIEIKANDVKVKLNSINQSAPFELIDFTGIIQLQSIQTKMNDWSEIIYSQKQTQFRSFLEQMSPSITLKFNIVSLYRDDNNINLTKEVILNQIHSMDRVVKNQYYLAQKLLFLEATNQRESKYELKRSLLKYYWERLPTSSMEQIPEVGYEKKKKFYLKHKEDRKSQSFLQFVQFIQNLEKDLKIDYAKIKDLQEKISKMHEQEAAQPKSEEQIQKCLKIFQKVEKKLFKYEKDLQIKLKNEVDNKKRVTLEHVIGCTQKIRIKIKILTEYFIRQLHVKKINLRKQLKNLGGKQLGDEFEICEQNSTQNVKQIIGLNEEQIKQLQTYLDNQLLDDDEKIVEKETKYDHDYNQSKAIFHFPFYRDPGAVLLEIIISSFVLSLINLAIFFQDMNQLSNIIASVSSLMISFIGMITIVQKQISSSSLSMIQVTFYLLFLTPIITLYYSYRTVTFQNIQPSIEFSYYNKFINMISNYFTCSLNQVPQNEYQNSLYFWYCFIVTMLGLGLPILLTIRFRFLKNNSNTNIRTIKQSEAISTLFPGSPDVDNIVFQKGSFQWPHQSIRQSTLHGAVISLMISYLLKLQTQRNDSRIKDILWNDQKGNRIDNKKYQKEIENCKHEIEKVERKKLLQQERQQEKGKAQRHMSNLGINLKFVLSFSKKVVSNMFGQKPNKQKAGKNDEINKLTETVLRKIGSGQL